MRCELAKQLEDAGNYEAALDAMGELWQGVGEQPLLEDLDQRTSANVLLRIGALTGYIGSAKQFENAQELAKNRITESIAIFESLYRGSDHSRYYVVSVKSDHQAQASFEQAIEISASGWSRSAGLAAIMLVEQIGQGLSDDDVYTILERARELLKDNPNPALQFAVQSLNDLKPEYHLCRFVCLHRIGRLPM